MDHWRYLLILGGCLLVTVPLEFLGSGVYRRPRRTAAAILPVAAIFVVWDLVAIAGGVWSYDPRYLCGVTLFGVMPLEELLFFFVIPLCGLLTFTAVEGVLRRARR
jgi:lycopene cyclase domain-containing protein